MTKSPPPDLHAILLENQRRARIEYGESRMLRSEGRLFQAAFAQRIAAAVSKAARRLYGDLHS